MDPDRRVVLSGRYIDQRLHLGGVCVGRAFDDHVNARHPAPEKVADLAGHGLGHKKRTLNRRSTIDMERSVKEAGLSKCAKSENAVLECCIRLMVFTDHETSPVLLFAL